jgi:hypothetical protein
MVLMAAYCSVNPGFVSTGGRECELASDSN